ncbi:MAG TPA: Asp-tRNA(Asn)/Glu-tRNA(Gln) amidotransferase subunit GatC [Candidatus Paceibacterota bacterium]|nr:Asp-tRNA(Asn)/Glu-tRNA(Gln) amidotransferase subunit GatC [Candidatus Paceibacterota bacterium]
MATPEDVKKLAELARIAVPDTELDAFTKEFDGVLAYIGRLEELSLAHAAPAAGALRNVLREDAAPHEPGRYTEALAAQFPKRAGDALSVQQIISYD